MDGERATLISIALLESVIISVLNDPNTDSDGAICKRKQIQLLVTLNADSEVGITFTDGNEKFTLLSSSINIMLLSESLTLTFFFKRESCRMAINTLHDCKRGLNSNVIRSMLPFNVTGRNCVPATEAFMKRHEATLRINRIERREFIDLDR